MSAKFSRGGGSRTFFSSKSSGEERAGCFTLSSWCLVVLPHGAVGLSAVCDCGIF